MKRPQATRSAGIPTHGLARVLSKRGVCSRSQAENWIRAGRVRVDSRVVRDPEQRTAADARIEIDGADDTAPQRLYLMLNKPRGLVTTAADERSRETVYDCFAGAGLPWIAPVGRLDKASEGLLLFSNDPEWGAGVSDPEARLEKTYHVQIDRIPDSGLLHAIERGVVDGDERLSACRVRLLRAGQKNAWLEIVLDEGRNRQIRRLLAALDVGVLRLVRVAIGGLQLGELPKSAWRMLETQEIAGLAKPARP